MGIRLHGAAAAGSHRVPQAPWLRAYGLHASGTLLAHSLRMSSLMLGYAWLAATLSLRTAGVVWLASLPPGLPSRLLQTPDGLLLGSDAGLYRLESGGWRLLLTRGGVVDLARGRDETWIASRGGLYLWPDGAESARLLRLGAGARVHAVAVAADARVFVATSVGLYLRAPGRRSFRRVTDLPAGAVQSVRVAGEYVWVAARGVLWRGSAATGFAPRLRSLQAGWWELRAALPDGEDTLLLVPEGVWRVGAGRERALELGLGELRDMIAVERTAWVASERGLFPLPLDGLEASAQAAHAADAFDIALGDGRLLVAARGGVVALPLERELPHVALADPGRPPVLDLPVLHRAVLRHQGLEAGRIEEIDERARGAALLPEVRLDLGFDRGSDHDRDRDQTFSSGQVHQLLDESSSRDDDFGVSLQLTWDLQRHRDPTRAIAVSRERRELVELRDQVLERVNRLYFERLRVLQQLASSGDALERGTLELRARELAAQLDAWSGGLFSRLDPTSPRPSRSLQ